MSLILFVPPVLNILLKMAEEPFCLYIVSTGIDSVLVTKKFKEYLNYRNTDWDDTDTDSDSDGSDNSEKTELSDTDFGYFGYFGYFGMNYKPHCVPRRRLEQFVELCHYDPKVSKFVHVSLDTPLTQMEKILGRDFDRDRFDQINQIDQILNRIEDIGMFERHEKPIFLKSLCSLIEQGSCVAGEDLGDGLYGLAIGDVSKFLSDTIKTYHKKGVCTYNVTDMNHIYQDWYTCATCDPGNTGVSICLPCAKGCHDGHDLTCHKAYSVPNLVNFCDCGAEELDILCKCLY